MDDLAVLDLDPLMEMDEDQHQQPFTPDHDQWVDSFFDVSSSWPPDQDSTGFWSSPDEDRVCEIASDIMEAVNMIDFDFDLDRFPQWDTHISESEMKEFGHFIEQQLQLYYPESVEPATAQQSPIPPPLPCSPTPSALPSLPPSPEPAAASSPLPPPVESEESALQTIRNFLRDTELPFLDQRQHEHDPQHDQQQQQREGTPPLSDLEAVYQHDCKFARVNNYLATLRFMVHYVEHFDRPHDPPPERFCVVPRSDFYHQHGRDFLEQQAQRVANVCLSYLQLPLEHLVSTPTVVDPHIMQTPRPVVLQLLGTPYELRLNLTSHMRSPHECLLDTLLTFFRHDPEAVTALGYLLRDWIADLDQNSFKAAADLLKKHDLCVNLRRNGVEHELSVYAPVSLLRRGDHLKLYVFPKYYTMHCKPALAAPFEPLVLVRVKVPVELEKRARIVAQSQCRLKTRYHRQTVGSSARVMEAAKRAADPSKISIFKLPEDLYQPDYVWMAVSATRELVRSVELDGRFKATPHLVLVLDGAFYPGNVLGEDLVASLVANYPFEALASHDLQLAQLLHPTLKSLVRYYDDVDPQVVLDFEKRQHLHHPDQQLTALNMYVEVKARNFVKINRLAGALVDGHHRHLDVYVRETRRPRQDSADDDRTPPLPRLFCCVCDPLLLDPVEAGPSAPVHAGFYLIVECGHVLCDKCVWNTLDRPCPRDRCQRVVRHVQKLKLS